MKKEIQSAYIVDDESLARYSLNRKLEHFSDIQVIGEADSVSSAVREIPLLNPEILFLDIQLTDGTGFDILNMLEYPGKVIFITAFDDYAIRAFEINALDYLMKPISVERLGTALKRLEIKNDSGMDSSSGKFRNDDKILVTKGEYIHFIQIDQIVIIKAARDYSLVLTCEGKDYLVSKTMNEWDHRLPEQIFCRVSRSMIVNIEKTEKSIKEYDGTALLYLTGISEPLKVSRSYFKKIRNRYT
jgi:two-component system LytT family response regulator